MTTIVRLSLAARSAMGEALIAQLDGGAGPATFGFFTAPIPASVNTAVTTQTRLGTLTASNPSAECVDGVIRADVITQDDEADADGDAAWMRAFDGDGTAVADFSVTDEAGDGAVKLNTVTIKAGGPILLKNVPGDTTQLKITMPGG